MQSNLLFQYSQKIIVLSQDKKSVLLARRNGEADYNGIFSFIGGKMETTDETIIGGIKREKAEEIGGEALIKILPNETYNLLFRKKDGSSMILPHIAAIFQGGDIVLSNEYSEYRWVPLKELREFEPKIENIPELVEWAVAKLSTAKDSHLIEI
ncbi:MAG: NUDIX hydrolase [Candidatus Saccharimonadales bacterium]